MDVGDALVAADEHGDVPDRGQVHPAGDRSLEGVHAPRASDRR